MNDELVQHQLEVLEKRTNNHGERLDKIEQDNASLKTEIKNLCENLKQLTIVMKWFIGLLVGAFVSFFFYAIQSGLFR
ncbi:hemolysin XhlA family protein [Clostridium ihumii]|uniref:hemolysin XhlA family protein n=1 Tax=Clostridium ihumii TaxID=1470356 RepID=UPI0005599A58|nr:hemolysin XhlA family protein [Clostridium ihumii]